MVSLEREIETLQGNVQDMQRQLSNAHKRIHDLIAEKSSAIDELEKEKDLVKELTVKLKETDKEASDLIQKQIDDWPDVLDSKPKNFKMPPQPGYRFQEGEKWVKIGADGEMEFEDIEIKK